MGIVYTDSDEFETGELVDLYSSVGWQHADFPDILTRAIGNSGYVVSAREDERLIGLARAITDWATTMYVVDVLVRPEYQRHGIGQELMRRLLAPFRGYHTRVLIAEPGLEEFYRKVGFEPEPAAMSIMQEFQDL